MTEIQIICLVGWIGFGLSVTMSIYKERNRRNKIAWLEATISRQGWMLLRAEETIEKLFFLSRQSASRAPVSPPGGEEV